MGAVGVPDGDGTIVPSSVSGCPASPMCDSDGSKSSTVAEDFSFRRRRRLRKKTARQEMETAPIPPTTPPAIAPAFELLEGGMGMGEGEVGYG